MDELESYFIEQINLALKCRDAKKNESRKDFYEGEYSAFKNALDVYREFKAKPHLMRFAE